MKTRFLGAAILQSLGIDTHNVLSFTIDCKSAAHLPTITLCTLMQEIPGEPIYHFSTREITAAHPLPKQPPPPYDIDQAARQASERLAEWVELEAMCIAVECAKDHLQSLIKFGVPVRKRHLAAACVEGGNWIEINALSEPESCYVPGFEWPLQGLI